LARAPAGRLRAEVARRLTATADGDVFLPGISSLLGRLHTVRMNLQGLMDDHIDGGLLVLFVLRSPCHDGLVIGVPHVASSGAITFSKRLIVQDAN
jgi:hypothetical protein